MKNTELFNRQKPMLIKYVGKNGVDSVSTYCTLTGLPVIIAYGFVADEFPEHKEFCETRIKVIKEFMGYK